MSTKPPWEDGAEGTAGSFGAWLRRQREIREITLREIADSSKISMRFLEALEQDRFDVLPAQVFVRGFLREYARFVGLDPQEVVNSFLAAQETAERTDEDPLNEFESRRSAPSIWSSGALLLAVVLLVFAVLVFLAYSGWGRGGDDERPAIAPPSPPPLELEEPVSEVEAAPVRLVIDFLQTSWVDAWIDGERAVSELRVQGESLALDAEREIRFRLRNSAGVRLELNGRAWLPDLEDDVEQVVDLALAQSLH